MILFRSRWCRVVAVGSYHEDFHPRRDTGVTQGLGFGAIVGAYEQVKRGGANWKVVEKIIGSECKILHD